MQGQENVRGGPGWATCPQEEMILGILEMSGTPQKPKMGNCYIRTSRDVGKTCQKLAENENIPFSHSCPLGPSRVLLMTKGGYGRHGLEVCKVRKMPRDDQLEQHFLGRESILGVLEMPGDPLEPLNQIEFRCGLDIKSSKFPGKTKYYIDFYLRIDHQRFDLIWCLRGNMFGISVMIYMPSVCKTTAPVPDSRRKNSLRCCDKLCSTSVLLREQSFKDVILNLLDLTWLCFNLQEGKPFSAVCAQLLAIPCIGLKRKLYRYCFVKKLKYQISHSVVGLFCF